MAKSARQLDALRERLSGLLADWATEVSAVMDALENQQSQAETQVDDELAKLRQRLRERDLALDHLTARSKEKDVELEAMRAELAARKSLVKSLRTDADRGKAFEKELAETRKVVATMKESLDRHARTIAELRQTLASRDRSETTEVDGGHTIVIDMTEPLRAARAERLRKTTKR